MRATWNFKRQNTVIYIVELSEVPLSRGKGIKNNGKFRDNDESWNLGEGGGKRSKKVRFGYSRYANPFAFGKSSDRFYFGDLDLCESWCLDWQTIEIPAKKKNIFSKISLHTLNTLSNNVSKRVRWIIRVEFQSLNKILS